MVKRRIIAILCMSILLSSCNFTNIDNSTYTRQEHEKLLEEAITTPYGKYPELITYTLGKMSGNNNSNMPEGDTYENNAYTRYLQDILNIQNLDTFEEKDDQYFITVNMAISAGEIPDIMLVQDAESVVALAERGLIEDLSESYLNCTSDVIKEIYNSYGNDIFESVTIDGKLMAIPETNISDGPNLIWLRKDWMDKLGLDPPKNVEDLVNIIRQFILQNPGDNEENETIGIVCDTSLCGENGYSSEYQLDIIFATFNSFPKQWIEDEDGNICYGSIQAESKEALAYLNDLYEEGILDKDFLLRTNKNIIDLIISGKCGSFFGPWWAPNNPLMDAMAADPLADWQPYLLETDDEGNTLFHSQNPSYKYVVVRKGYEYPEIVCKMISVIFDYSRYHDVDNVEISSYFQQNVDPTARPVAINVDYNEALSKCYTLLMDGFNGVIDVNDMPLLERSYYLACKSYLENKEEASLEEWAAYQSRITACSLLTNENIKEVKSLFFGETETMKSKWWMLKDLEQQAFLKIVCGVETIDYFDEFVEQWLNNGGELITKEVSEKLNG